MISFRSKTKDFKSALNSIRAIHKGKHIHTYRETCEITLIDNYVRVSIPGSSDTMFIKNLVCALDGLGNFFIISLYIIFSICEQNNWKV
jgi:hypothetical protein